MPGWVAWVLLGLAAWTLVAILFGATLARLMRGVSAQELRTTAGQETRRTVVAASSLVDLPAASVPWPSVVRPGERRRILVVDDDAGLRLLLRTTLAADEFAVEETASAEEAADVARFWSPDVVILDIGLPGIDGLTFCRALKRNAGKAPPIVVLLTGGEVTAEAVAAAGADEVLRKPFSPLQLVALLEDVSEPGRVTVPDQPGTDAEQLLVYARDLGRLLAAERSQRRLLQCAYRQTAIAFADALEAKDPVTGLHALRVQRYALELTAAVDHTLLADPSLEYGFLLHDVGKIGVPDTILQKRGPLDEPERRLMQRHAPRGAELLAGIPLLEGAGLDVVRSHHERWDGTGYPQGLAGTEIPIGARIFALVDAVDAMTSDRPYRRAMTWENAVDEILVQNGTQFDPRVVAAFARREPRLRRIAADLAERAA
jgi:putative two-component system response regulator